MRDKIVKVLLVVVLLFVVFGATSCGKDSKTTAYLNEVSESKGCSTTVSKTKIEWIDSKVNVSGATSETFLTKTQELISTYVLEDVIAKNNHHEADDDYMVCKLRLVAKKYNDKLSSQVGEYIYDSEDLDDLLLILNGAAGCLDVKNKQGADKAISDFFAEGGSEFNVARIISMYIIEVQDVMSTVESEPIQWKGGSFANVMANFWNNFFIFPVGWLVYQVSNLLGGYYWLGLIIVTLLIRVLGWPIYSKSNDMQAKMGQMQPELTKIQEKYAGKQDPQSQRQMQMEQAQLYKKYGVGVGGCLAPFIQFPIFIAVYRAISRMPFTVAIDGSSVGSNYVCHNNWANVLNSKILGVDLFADKTGGGTSQLIGVIILVVLVVGTQILSNFITKARQKKMSEAQQANIPAYRRQAYNQQQNNSQMNMMLYMMMFMMGIFVWSSKAGLGLYWLIGNVFSMAQMWINGVTQEKKLEKERNANNIYTVKTDKRGKK